MSRPSKRARRSDSSNEAQDATPEDKHTIFTAWALERGVEINSVLPQQLPGRGLGLMTTAAIKKGSRLLFVPEKAMFKPDSAFIKRSGLSSASPQAKLSLSILAKCNTAHSPLTTWQATWPTKEDFDACMPLSWPEDVLAFLPPAVLAPFERQKADYARDWEAAAALCEERGWSEEEFKYYWCIVNSRSFHWKPLTGGAGSMCCCPFVDYMNHGPTGSGCEVKQTSKGYEVVAERDYEIGEEVLATYGAHSNDKLLVHYGFICASPIQHSSPDDEIRLDHVIIPHLSGETKSQLQDVGFLGSYALLPIEYPCYCKIQDDSIPCKDHCRQPWELCFKTQVAVRAVLLTANEWEYFVTNGEDLSGDQSAAVNKWLKPHLQDLRTEALQKCTDLQRLRNTKTPSSEYRAVAVGMLEDRWLQISGHLDNFLSSM